MPASAGKRESILLAAVAILLIPAMVALILYLRGQGATAPANPFGGPPNHLSPSFQAPMASSANQFHNDPSQYARLTSNNLQILLGSVMVYRGNHDQQLPRTLEELDNHDPSHPLISPYDHSMGNHGYVYLPDNIVDRKDKVCMYDAAELSKTGSTHVIMSDTRQVRVMEKAQLAHQPGVTLP